MKRKPIERNMSSRFREKDIGKFWRYFRECYPLYILILPSIVFVIVFSYIPMYGIQIAFRDYKFSLGIWGSEWAGLKHFFRYINSANFWPLIRNTLRLSIYSLLFGFPAPLLFAVLINELRSLQMKRTIQMISYAPHFISTVALCGMITLFLQKDNGIINVLIGLTGGTPKNFLADPASFPAIYVLSGIWQGLGWNSIIYLAALSSIDPQLVEAARIDGATRLQKIGYIDLSGIAPTIIILLILSAGSLLGSGFEKILLLQNNLNMNASDVISTFVYRLGIQNAQYSYTTAIGFFNSVVTAVILISVNKLAKVITDTSLW